MIYSQSSDFPWSLRPRNLAPKKVSHTALYILFKFPCPVAQLAEWLRRQIQAWYLGSKLGRDHFLSSLQNILFSSRFIRWYDMKVLKPKIHA